jgi:hypothetical protein
MGGSRLMPAKQRRRRLAPVLRRQPWKRRAMVAPRSIPSFHRANTVPVQDTEPLESSETVPTAELPANTHAETAFANSEYLLPQRPIIIRALFRVVGLTSDITLLLLLSPCFAAWFAYRTLRNLIRLRRSDL